MNILHGKFNGNLPTDLERHVSVKRARFLEQCPNSGVHIFRWKCSRLQIYIINLRRNLDNSTNWTMEHCMR